MIMEGADFMGSLGDRGQRLWDEMTAGGQLPPAHLVLLEEACRIADRLDVMDAIIRRWSEPSDEDEGGSGDITGLFAESRQQATALKGIVAEIRQVQKASGAALSAPAKKVRGSGVADLSQKIAERRRKAQG
ncbi:hypothetical protein [Streptomyces sp. NPDC050534]|uniref:hypothetical protein n=1 Tax=Streptomyces sp. NPDC050534 TaxID=3365625 RepID=UPI0037902C38